MDKEIPKQRVAIFKSMPDQPTSKDRYVGVLEANGMEAVAVPTLSFQFQVDHLLACLQNPEAYSGFLLTSQRAVESIRFACDQIGCELPASWKAKRHFCVGIQTHDTATKLLDLIELLGSECGNADQLGALILKEVETNQLPLLFPCSSLKMETLPRLMTENHIAFEAITSYVTVAHPQLEEMVTALTVRKPDCFAFFSPSGVDFALPLLLKYNLIAESKVVSIGNTTCGTLEKAKIKVDKVCAKPTPEHLLEAVKSSLF